MSEENRTSRARSIRFPNAVLDQVEKRLKELHTIKTLNGYVNELIIKDLTKRILK